VGTVPVVAAAAASADASGAMVVTLTAPLPAAVTSATVRLDVGVESLLSPPRTSVAGADAGSGKFVLIGGLTYEDPASTTSAGDQTVSVYNPASKTLTALAATLTYPATLFNPVVTLNDGRLLIVDLDVEAIDLSAGTVTINAVL